MNDEPKWCCKMRRHFVLGIVGVRKEPYPVDLVDFIDFDKPSEIRIKYCPFCGVVINDRKELRNMTDGT